MTALALAMICGALGCGALGWAIGFSTATSRAMRSDFPADIRPALRRRSKRP